MLCLGNKCNYRHFSCFSFRVAGGKLHICIRLCTFSKNCIYFKKILCIYMRIFWQIFVHLNSVFSDKFTHTARKRAKERSKSWSSERTFSSHKDAEDFVKSETYQINFGFITCRTYFSFDRKKVILVIISQHKETSEEVNMEIKHLFTKKMKLEAILDLVAQKYEVAPTVAFQESTITRPRTCLVVQ